jgi:hypothetical protein
MGGNKTKKQNATYQKQIDAWQEEENQKYKEYMRRIGRERREKLLKEYNRLKEELAWYWNSEPSEDYQVVPQKIQRFVELKGMLAL